MNSCSYCQSRLEPKQLSDLVSILKIVSEENRLKILCLLNQGELCVCKIVENINLSQSLISHHLSDLKEAKLIQSEKRGLFVHYSLTDEGKRITNLIFKI